MNGLSNIYKNIKTIKLVLNGLCVVSFILFLFIQMTVDVVLFDEMVKKYPNSLNSITNFYNLLSFNIIILAGALGLSFIVNVIEDRK